MAIVDSKLESVHDGRGRWIKMFSLSKKGGASNVMLGKIFFF